MCLSPPLDSAAALSQPGAAVIATTQYAGWETGLHHPKVGASITEKLGCCTVYAVEAAQESPYKSIQLRLSDAEKLRARNHDGQKTAGSAK